MSFSQKIEEGTAARQNRTRGVAIAIDSRSPRREQKPANGQHLITQGRLAEGLRLHREELRVIQAVREFRLQVERDLATGSEIEGGDLTYDPELKIVRRTITNGTAGL